MRNGGAGAGAGVWARAAALREKRKTGLAALQEEALAHRAAQRAVMEEAREKQRAARRDMPGIFETLRQRSLVNAASDSSTASQTSKWRDSLPSRTNMKASSSFLLTSSTPSAERPPAARATSLRCRSTAFEVRPGGANSPSPPPAPVGTVVSRRHRADWKGNGCPVAEDGRGGGGRSRCRGGGQSSRAANKRE
ncbi:unnamed protein product, partial [Discosporangium mesarthrocarpum]